MSAAKQAHRSGVVQRLYSKAALAWNRGLLATWAGWFHMFQEVGLMLGPAGAVCGRACTVHKPRGLFGQGCPCLGSTNTAEPRSLSHLVTWSKLNCPSTGPPVYTGRQGLSRDELLSTLHKTKHALTAGRACRTAVCRWIACCPTWVKSQPAELAGGGVEGLSSVSSCFQARKLSVEVVRWAGRCVRRQRSAARSCEAKGGK
jgi:hypothetical protein